MDEARAAYRSAIDDSPQSPFLHRELAEVERRAGNLEAAMPAARRASELDPDDPRAHVVLGEIYEAQGEYARAAEAFTAAVSIQPDEALDERIEALRSRLAFAAMPPEYRAIEESPAITRAQLAALLAVRLDALLGPARRVNAVVVTDTRGHWASPYILTVARAGVMDVFPNHTFQPDAAVRRSDLALAASRVLQLMAARDPALAAKLRGAPARRFPDVGPRHLDHPAASLAVEAGVLDLMPDGTVQLARRVSGAEAAAAVSRLQDMGGPPAR